jgi:hypothetical protein
MGRVGQFALPGDKPRPAIMWPYSVNADAYPLALLPLYSCHTLLWQNRLFRTLIVLFLNLNFP